MMKFLIQTVNGKCALDLCQAMEKAEEFYRWKNDAFEIAYADMEDMIEYDAETCPVGTLEFVFKYVDGLYGKDEHLRIKPINVPDWARPYAIGGYVINIGNVGKDADIISKLSLAHEHRMFMKSRNDFKSPINGFIDCREQIKDNVQLVLEGDIVSEWRIFVHKGKNIDIKNYSGDPFAFPDADRIHFFESINDSIKEGTVDICITSDGTMHIMECHDFFSCGLYGFADYNALPLMLWRTWCKIKRTNLNS